MPTPDAGVVARTVRDDASRGSRQVLYGTMGMGALGVPPETRRVRMDAALAWRQLVVAAGLVFAGNAFIGVVRTPEPMPSAVHVAIGTHVVLGCLVMLWAVVRRESLTEREAAGAFILLAVPLFPGVWLKQSALLSRSFPWSPFTGLKLSFAVIAALAPGGRPVRLGGSLIGVLCLQVLVMWFGLDMERAPYVVTTGEPWMTLFVAGVAWGLLFYRWRQMVFQRELLITRADAEALRRTATQLFDAGELATTSNMFCGDHLASGTGPTRSHSSPKNHARRGLVSSLVADLSPEARSVDRFTQHEDVMSETDTSQSRERPQARVDAMAWGSAMVTGMLLAIFGLIATFASTLTGFISILFIGLLLAVGGVIEVVHGLAGRRRARAPLLHLLGGLLMAVVGVLFIARPGGGVAAVTLLLAGYFFASGLFSMITSMSDRYTQWGWDFAYGALAMILGAIVVSQWPVSALWLIGVLVGLELVFRGVALMAGGMALRRLFRRPAT